MWPVEHPLLVGVYGFDSRTPYAAGMRRSIHIRPAAGNTVRAPCPGRVRFAGHLPLSALGVTISCGALRATLVGLQAIDVQPGRVVAAGAILGRVARDSELGLSARIAGSRNGYRDPLALLEPQVRNRPPLTSTWAPRPRRTPPGTPSRPPVPAATPARRAAPVHGSPVAWLGLALLGAALGSGLTLHARVVRRVAWSSRRSADPVARPGGP